VKRASAPRPVDRAASRDKVEVIRGLQKSVADL
jgi:hypothetical protein